MLKIDNSLLQEVGLGALPSAEKNSFLKHIYETLEMRVGIRLADQMSNQQLDEFERYFEAKDDAGAFKWLETNFPNYKEIVQQEFDKLKAEVAQSAPQILAASQQAAAHGAQGGSVASGQSQHQPQAAVPAQPAPAAPAAQQPYLEPRHTSPAPQAQASPAPAPSPNPGSSMPPAGLPTNPPQPTQAAPAPAAPQTPQFQQPQAAMPQQPQFPPQQPPAGPPQQ